MPQPTSSPSDIDVDLLDPKNDFVFKKLFATSPTLLAALINAVRSDEPPIEVVEVINPRIDSDELKGKFIVLDILVKDQQGHYYNIEMQVCRYDAWSARSTYYLARTLSTQIVSGQDYQALKPVIGIHLLNFDLFDAPNQTQQAQWCFELRDRKNPQIKLGDELQVHIIELSKADRLGHWPRVIWRTGLQCLNTGRRNAKCKPSNTPRSNKPWPG